MTQDNKVKIDRRDLLRALGVSAGAAASPVAMAVQAQADSGTSDDKRKARYDANSADVQAFYRVNRYPK
jgi:hypothetical protein